MKIKTAVAAVGAVLLLVLTVHSTLICPPSWEVSSGGTSVSPDVSVLLSTGSSFTFPGTHNPLL
ncbi:hypothetical protein [Thermococcus sp.]|uniref:hypothetical protein n=1 Tax=Thermococcus sp. TaxID=35749 RepID=UPI002603DAA8|nr:hypothetical protein [Thermococcus sp.]